MDPKTAFLIAAFMAVMRPAFAQAPAEPRAALAGSPPSRRACPPDWEKKRVGDCWTSSTFGQGMVSAYVHRGGWVLDAQCLDDKRFTAASMLGALDDAARKIDPALSVDAGGCLGTYNPDWARALKGEVWSQRMRVTCPKNVDPKDEVCANAGKLQVYVSDAAGNSRPDESRLITVRNVAACMGPGTSGLSGVLFHETLHAADADSVPLAEHNQAWTRGQLDFIRDRVYATEALCAFGADPALRKTVNVLQCKEAVRYRSENPRLDLCKGFGMSFTDMPMGAIKH